MTGKPRPLEALNSIVSAGHSDILGLFKQLKHKRNEFVMPEQGGCVTEVLLSV
jgi:hypothetical protein